MKNIYQKFSNCLISKGYKNSIVNDIQNKNYFVIPNSISDIMNSRSFTKESFLLNNKKEALRFLLENKIIFKSNDKCINMFPHFNLKYSSPNFIENVILDRKAENIKSIKDIINKIDELLCNAMQLRFYNRISKDYLPKILKYINYSSIETIEVFMPYSTYVDDYYINRILHLSTKITLLIIYNSPFFMRKEINQMTYTFLKKNIIFKEHCGFVNHNNFISGVKFVSLSNTYNSCLYKKLSIDENGYIKNCPSMSKHYGHISNTNVAEVVQSTEFQKLWHIKKDDIKVCQDCEFRHMCMDCRAYIKNPNDIYSQPAKCPYNPYIAKWQGQEGYITVEQWQKQNPNWEQQAKEQRQTTY